MQGFINVCVLNIIMNIDKIESGFLIFKEFCKLNNIKCKIIFNSNSIYNVVQISVERFGDFVSYNFSKNEIENLGDEFDFLVNLAHECIIDLTEVNSKLYLDLYDKNSGL